MGVQWSLLYRVNMRTKAMSVDELRSFLYQPFELQFLVLSPRESECPRVGPPRECFPASWRGLCKNRRAKAGRRLRGMVGRKD